MDIMKLINKFFKYVKNFIKKNMNVIIMAAVVMLLLEMNERKKPIGSRKNFFKDLGNAVWGAVKKSPVGQAASLTYTAITDPKKAKRKLEGWGKGIARDFANAGKGIASAGDDLYHGRIADAYHDVTHGADGLARRVGDAATGGAVSALSDATGRDALDFFGRAQDFATGVANVAGDLAHGNVRGAYDDYVNTTSPYLQFGANLATDGLAQTIADNTGLVAGDYVGNIGRIIKHPGDVGQGLVNSGIDYGVGQASSAVMQAGDRHRKIKTHQKSVFD